MPVLASLTGSKRPCTTRGRHTSRGGKRTRGSAGASPSRNHERPAGTGRMASWRWGTTGRVIDGTLSAPRSSAGRFGFLSVEVAPGAAGAERRQRQRLRQSQRMHARQIIAADRDSAVDLPSRNNGAPTISRRVRPGVGVGPRSGVFPEIEERGQHIAHVLPVIGIVGLDHEARPAGASTP